jgi:preprotein translocase subunit SecE
MRGKMLRILRTLNPTRRSYMLDVIIVLVTIVTFVAFIGFTEGCERL